MSDLCIICEKPSAAQDFAKALGGMSGSFDGKSYQIIALAGHTMEFKMPNEMVSAEKSAQYKSWDIEYLPWNVTDMDFSRRAQKGKSALIDKVRKAATTTTAFVSACDVDPSGEGGLIAGEVLKEIQWRGPVYRMYFVDQSPKKIQAAFRTMQMITMAKDAEILKAETRARWDFLSMQITRIATNAARELGLAVVLRNGRLKSVINRIIFEQEEARRLYKRKPYYEAQFKDDKGHVYKRQFKDGDTWRFDKKDDVPLGNYHQSGVVEDGRVRKSSGPGPLLDLLGLTSELAPQGYSSKAIEQCYQKLYEAKTGGRPGGSQGFVSYPRTEDKVITHEQFNEMLPLIDDIASVVGVDTSKLTHRIARKTHVRDGGAHGANRPGTRVPVSLDELSQYDGGNDGLAAAIYTTLAKNFLAMFGEDYQYDAVKGHVVDYPDFKTAFSIPVVMGYKDIFSIENDDNEDDTTTLGIGSIADPIIGEGANKKPAAVTIKWLKRQLEKYEVGTGATRTGTLAELTSDKVDRRLLNESKGKLALTSLGQINAVLLKGTRIADPSVTEELFLQMEDVGNGKRQMAQVVDTATATVEHDMKIIMANIPNAKVYYEKVINGGGKAATSLSKLTKKKAVRRKMVFKGQEIELNPSIFGVRDVTDDELAQLSTGQTVVLQYHSAKYHKDVKAQFAIAKDPKFGWGLKCLGFVKDGPAKVKGMFKGKEIEFTPKFMDKVFTQDEINRLLSGEEMQVTVQSSKGPWSPVVHLRHDAQYGWGVGPIATKPKGKPTTIADMKPEWGGHVFTDDEKQLLLDGVAVQLETRTGKKALMKFGKVKSDKGFEYWGYYVEKWL